MKTTVLTAQFEADGDAIQDRSRSLPWWLYANLLSLDAPIVAVVWLFAFSREFQSPVIFPVYAVLFLSVWSIYLADRLLDGFRQVEWGLATERHRFVRRYQKRFMSLLLVTLSVSALLTFKFLAMDLIVTGLVLCAAVFVYFTAFVRLFPQWKPLRAKEFACGFVFAVGTAIGVDAVRHGVGPHPEHYLPVILLFGALCIFNCLVISARERHTDQVNDPAAASIWWIHLDRDLAALGMALMALSGFAWIVSGQADLYSACFISALALTGVHLFRGHFSSAMPRVLADAALLSPLMLLI